VEKSLVLYRVSYSVAMDFVCATPARREGWRALLGGGASSTSLDLAESQVYLGPLYDLLPAPLRVGKGGARYALNLFCTQRCLVCEHVTKPALCKIMICRWPSCVEKSLVLYRVSYSVAMVFVCAAPARRKGRRALRGGDASSASLDLAESQVYLGPLYDLLPALRAWRGGARKRSTSYYTSVAASPNSAMHFLDRLSPAK